MRSVALENLDVSEARVVDAPETIEKLRALEHDPNRTRMVTQPRLRVFESALEQLARLRQEYRTSIGERA